MSLAEDLSNVGMDGLSDEDQEQLVAVLDQYMIAYEEGRSPDIDGLVKKHPHLEEPIRQYLAPLDLINQATEQHAVVGVPGTQGNVQLTDYQVGEVIGQGAMGTVYSAVHKESGETVALKVLSSGSIVNSQVVKRFMREARVAESLSHNNIVPVFDIGCEIGVHFYTMQKIDGASLDERIHGARLLRRQGQKSDSVLFSEDRYSELASRFAEVADALDLAHQSQIVHRDIKPSNILQDENEKLWVTDFGLVRDGKDCGLTATGDVIGTYRYMSPEQARGENDKIGPQADVYSLGATLFEVLTLRPVFRGNDVARLLMKVEQNATQSPRHWNSNIPIDLETIVLKAICPDVATRYESAQALAEDLRRFARGQRIRARRKSSAQRFIGWVSERRNTLVPVACVLMMCLAWSLMPRGGGADVGHVTSSRSALICEIAETRLAALKRDSDFDSRLGEDVERTLKLLENHSGHIDQVYLYSRLLNQWATANRAKGRTAVSESSLETARLVNSLLPATPRAQLLRTLTSVNLLLCEPQSTLAGVPDEALALVKKCSEADLPNDANEVAYALLRPLNQVSRRFVFSDNLDQAETFAVAALQLSARLGANNVLVGQFQLADINGNLGEIRFRLGGFRSSITPLESAIGLLESDGQDVTHLKGTRLALLSLFDLLGLAYLELNQTGKARTSYERALELIEDVSADSSDVLTCVRGATLCNNAGRFFRSTEESARATRLFTKASSFQERAVRLEPKNVGYRKVLDTIERNRDVDSASTLVLGG